MKQLTFNTKQNLILENSFGTIREESDVNLIVNLSLFIKDTYSAFEFYDEDTGGENWYAEGGIWHSKDKVIYEYDGVFSLPKPIIHKLNELGFDTEDL